MHDSIIRVGIVDDHAIVRSGLRQFLAEHVDLRVVGEAGSGAEAIALVQSTQVDVLLLDLSMPGQDGSDAIPVIRSQAPATGILVLSGYPAELYAPHLIRTGANGYLNKECPPGHIVDAIRTVARGRSYLPPGMDKLPQQILTRNGEGPLHKRLSDREFQVLLRLARGGTAGQIAQDMQLSVKTVSTYRARIFQKMGLGSNTDLTYYALKNKLID
jgi:two-component system, NarL family, invasion response regulator UvrY